MNPDSTMPGELTADEERAVRTFERYLEQCDEGDAPSFEDYANAHPRERERLLAMMKGYGRFDAIRRTVASSAAPSRSETRTARWKHAAAAAVAVSLLAASVVLIFRIGRSPERIDGIAPRSPFATATRALTEPLLAYGDLLSDAAQWGKISDAVLDDLAQCFAGANALASDAASDDADRALLRARVDGFRAIVAAVGGARSEALLTKLDAASFDTLRDPEVQFMLAAAGPPPEPASTPSQGVLAAVLTELERARVPQLLRLRVIDLDAGGVETQDVDVFAEPADLIDGSLGEPIALGRSPELSMLPPGDYRITVVAGGGRRYSELRVLVVPGEDVPPRLAFLRDTATTTAEMIRVAAATIPYGAAPDSTEARHRAMIAAEVPEFWIDRCELTNEEYARFYRAAMDHPEWFAGGYGPGPRRPSARAADGQAIFDQDGNCRADYARHPVVTVDWYSASLCANWLGKRLPSDREWESAAGGPSGHRYPWGGDYDASRVYESHELDPERGERQPDGSIVFAPRLGTGPVDAFSAGATPEGVLRLGDNAAEWVEDLFTYTRPDDPPGTLRFFSADRPAKLMRCVRGSSWQFVSPVTTQVDMRRPTVPTAPSTDIGVRCAKSMRPDLRRD